VLVEEEAEEEGQQQEEEPAAEEDRRLVPLSFLIYTLSNNPDKYRGFPYD
jgi:hypothetical protein